MDARRAANARLIAKAPQMYGLLREFVGMGRHLAVDSAQFHEAMCEAAQLLAEIDGGSHD